MTSSAGARNSKRRSNARDVGPPAEASATAGGEEEEHGSVGATNENSTDSSSSSSESESSLRTTGGDWKLNLSNFTKTQTKLETVINNSHKCREIVTAYFDKANKKNVICLSWEEGQPEYGINPLHRFLYTSCEPSDELAVRVSPNGQSVKLTDVGRAITRSYTRITKRQLRIL